jgi:hypothetical protein
MPCYISVEIHDNSLWATLNIARTGKYVHIKGTKNEVD